MAKQVTVIVEGKEYVVEVGDLNERPVRAVVNSREYRVEVPAGSAEEVKPAAAPPPPAESPPAQATPAAAVIPTPEGSGAKTITAPMPGDILAVEVQPGTNVCAGDVICILEAMKMKNMIRAPRAGVVASVNVTPGQAVDYGAILVTFE